MTPEKPTSNEEVAKDVTPRDEDSRKQSSRRRAIIRLTVFGVVLLAVIGSVIFFSSRLNASPTYTGGKVVGKLVPDVTVTTLEGKKISLRALTGKRVIVNFFNSWCIPCQDEEPALEEFAHDHEKDPDFVFIGIVRDDSKANIVGWTQGRDVPFQVTLDHDEDASIAFGTTGQPETYAIDPSGRVVASLLARADENSLNQIWNATQ